MEGDARDEMLMSHQQMGGYRTRVAQFAEGQRRGVPGAISPAHDHAAVVA